MDRVSEKQFFEGETQQITKLLPEAVNEAYSNLVSLESLKGIWEALSASLEMQLVSWKRDLFI